MAARARMDEPVDGRRGPAVELHPHTRRSLVTFVAGVAAAAVASALAIYAVGPLTRAVIGAPLDFNTDYTSPEAMRQALAVFAASFAIVFFFLGYSRRGHGAPWKTAFLLANPLTIAAGFGLVRQAAILHHPDEYCGLFSWAVLSLCGAWICAPLIALGFHLQSRPR
jgi:hypothetical protein